MPVKQGRAGEMAAAIPSRLQSRHVPTLPPSTLRGRHRTGHTARNGRPAAARRTLAALLAVFTLGPARQPAAADPSASEHRQELRAATASGAVPTAQTATSSAQRHRHRWPGSRRSRCRGRHDSTLKRFPTAAAGPTSSRPLSGSSPPMSAYFAMIAGSLWCVRGRLRVSSAFEAMCRSPSSAPRAPRRRRVS
jgi:hypothetical protein